MDDQPEGAERIALLEKALLSVQTKIVADTERIALLEKAVADSREVEADTQQRMRQLEELVGDQASALRILETNTVRAIAETIVEKLDDVGRKIDANAEQIAKLEKRLEAVEEQLQTWWNQDNHWTPVSAAEE